MKEKTPEPGSTDHNPVRPGETPEQPSRPARTMQTEFQTRKARGRLTREDQRRLGDVLQRVYDDVLKQGVPDRFKTLIDQLGRDEGVPGATEEVGPDDHQASPNPKPVHGLQAKGGDKSKDQS